MQFKHPELLWALFLLLIPLFIHLFQLRKFKKTPFTNVKVLRKMQSESRRSSTLKKWLLLLTRMALLAGLIIAFAQPFFAEKSALKKKETVIYLDNSYSMQAKTEGTTLLENAVQELIKAIPTDDTFSLITNENTYRDVRIQDIQNDLLTLTYTEKQLDLNEISLKANTLFKTNNSSDKNLIVISDFQQRLNANATIDSSNIVKKHLIKLGGNETENIAIDSVYLEQVGIENSDLIALLSSSTAIENIPVSLYNDNKLIAKTSAVFNERKTAKVSFTLPANQEIKGKLTVSDTGLAYDNQFYFNIDKKEKIKITAIGPKNSDYLGRIYTEDEFLFSSYHLKNLNYSSLDSQNTIILNELETIPNPLTTSLISFINKGGSLLIIPAVQIDRDSYNTLTKQMGTTFLQRVSNEKNITKISFSHPLYNNVFEKNIQNFQYPKVAQHFNVRTNRPAILSLQDNAPFLIGSDEKYVFTASIAEENSNFKNSPLIVPTLYNIGSNSLKIPNLYKIIGKVSQVDVSVQLAKDNILKINKEDFEFIPRQKALANKVSLLFQDEGISEGIYKISHNSNTLKNISFNHSRDESKLQYLDIAQLHAESQQNSVASLFEDMQNDNRITELWKWFVILALLFLLVEVLIQKLL